MISDFLTFLFSLPFILIGGATSVGAVYYCLTTLKLFMTGTVTIGTIVRLESSTDSDGDTFYYPIIKFWTRAEKAYEFKHNLGTPTTRGYKPGQDVRVIYNPEDPQEAKIKSGYALWFVPIFLGIFGIAFMWAGLAILSETFR